MNKESKLYEFMHKKEILLEIKQLLEYINNIDPINY